MSTAIFDRVSSLVEEIGMEKKAAAKAAMDDPGGQDGPSTHPSATKDDNELSQPAPEGAQSADNESAVKEQTPNVPDNDPELTPDAAPTQDEVQLGQGVDKAKATGDDPGTEEDYKGDKEDPAEAGHKDMGGTSHPATGDIGEKYSSLTRESVADMSDNALFKAAADLGGEIAADLANGFYGPSQSFAGQSAKVAASNGYNTAAAAAPEMADTDVFASAIIGETVKSAQHQAELVADYVVRLQHDLAKKANDELADPTSGAAEGEAFGSDPAMAGGGGGGGEEALLAAMAGGGAEGLPPEVGAEEELPPEAAFAEGLPPEALAGGPEGALGGPEDTLEGMPEEDAVQELAMALQELGIDPAELAAAAGASADEAAPKLASAVDSYTRSGRFQITEAKQGTAQRQVRDYMKGYVSELVRRN